MIDETMRDNSGDKRPEETVINLIGDWLKIAELCGAPAKLGLEQARKQAEKLGVDISPLVNPPHQGKAETPSEPQEPDNVVYLTVKEMAEYFGISSSAQMNKLLSGFGLQRRLNQHWAPTWKGCPLCIEGRYIDKRGHKTGRPRLLWDVEEVEKIVKLKGIG